MSLIGGAGRSPEVNEQLVDEQHRIERERAMETHIADQVYPTWWQRLFRRLKHEPLESED